MVLKSCSRHAVTPPPNDDIRLLTSLLQEKRTLNATSPSMFPHIQRLVELEISRIRKKVFKDELVVDLKLPEPVGEKKTMVKKIFLPCEKYPDVNFVGRIIGPRGMTTQQIERATGCKVMIRGKGSMRDGEQSPRARTNTDHLEEDLHVLVHCDDTPNRADARLEKVTELINKISIPPSDDGPDDIKIKQLVELAIMNGTYREKNSSNSSTSVHLVTPSSSGYRTHGNRSPHNSRSNSSYGSSSSNESTTWIWDTLGINTPSPAVRRSDNIFNFDV